MGKLLTWLGKVIKNELQMDIDNWYFLKDQMVILRYGFFDDPFLVPKHPPIVLISLKMAQQVVEIESKFGFEGNFKTIYSFPSAIGSITMMEIDYAKDIKRFIIDNFKVVKARDPWMHDPLGVFLDTTKRNNKCLAFKHHLYPQIECYLNQIEKETEETLKWILALLKAN